MDKKSNPWHRGGLLGGFGPSEGAVARSPAQTRHPKREAPVRCHLLQFRSSSNFDNANPSMALAAGCRQQNSRAPRRNVVVGGYTIKHGLGEGSYGKVFCAVKEVTGEAVALKFVLACGR